LLTASLKTPLGEIMVRRVVAIPATATVLDACEFFVLYKFLAFPVVDEHRHRPAESIGAEFFEALGFHIEQIRGASPWRGFRFRFPWLLVTVSGGTLSAILVRYFEATLTRSLVLAFFLTMV